VVPAVNMREEDRGSLDAGMKPYHVPNRASPAARTNQFNLIQQRVCPLNRLVQVETGLIRLHFVYQYQGTGTAPYCVTIESVVAPRRNIRICMRAAPVPFAPRAQRPTPSATGSRTLSPESPPFRRLFYLHPGGMWQDASEPSAPQPSQVPRRYRSCHGRLRHHRVANGGRSQIPLTVQAPTRREYRVTLRHHAQQ
jgi:hypothetical protein